MKCKKLAKLTDFLISGTNVNQTKVLFLIYMYSFFTKQPKYYLIKAFTRLETAKVTGNEREELNADSRSCS